jgi:hypothetical protein
MVRNNTIGQAGYPRTGDTRCPYCTSDLKPVKIALLSLNIAATLQTTPMIPETVPTAMPTIGRFPRDGLLVVAGSPHAPQNCAPPATNFPQLEQYMIPPLAPNHFRLFRARRRFADLTVAMSTHDSVISAILVCLANCHRVYRIGIVRNNASISALPV